MSDTRDDIINQFREQQRRYTYYVIALCVAGIGFSVQQTMGLPMNETQIPLAVAVFCWGISIWCGLRFLGIMTAALYSNAAMIQMQEGWHPDTGRHPEKIKIGVEAIEEGLNRESQKTVLLASWQNRLFYIGIICFVGWRVLEMYLASIK